MGKMLSNYRMEAQKLCPSMETTSAMSYTRVNRKASEILKSRKGLTYGQIADVLQVTPTTAWRWLNKDEATANPGRPCKICAELHAVVQQALRESPRVYGYDAERWNPTLLQKYVYRTIGRTVSTRSIYTVTRRLRSLEEAVKMSTENRKYAVPISDAVDLEMRWEHSAQTNRDLNSRNSPVLWRA